MAQLSAIISIMIVMTAYHQISSGFLFPGLGGGNNCCSQGLALPPPPCSCLPSLPCPLPQLPPPCPPPPPPVFCPPPQPPPMPCPFPLPPPPCPAPQMPPPFYGGISSYQQQPQPLPIVPAWNDCCCMCASPCRYRSRRMHGAKIAVLDTKCNDEDLRQIMKDSMTSDATSSKRLIQKNAQEKLKGRFDVICSKGEFSYIANTNHYCQESHNSMNCYAFRQLYGERAAGDPPEV